MNQAAARISVVIPTFNRAGIVGAAIDSVLSQSFAAYEVIVVDDGSSDGTGERLRAYEGRIRSIRRDNGGLSRARNTGIEAATGEWVAFLDDDDEYRPGKLAACAEFVERRPGIDVFASNTAIVSADGSSVDLFRMRGVADPGEMGVVERPLPYVLASCFFAQSIMVRRTALLAAGMFTPDRYYEDLDLASRLAVRGPWVIDNRQLISLCRRSDTDYTLSAQWAKRPVESFRSLVEIYEHLAGDGRLSPSERGLVIRRLSSYRFELGAALLRAGRRAEAKVAFLQAARDCPTLKTRLKSALALSLGRAGLRVKEMAGRDRRGRFMRSDA